MPPFVVCLAPARFGPWGFLFGVASRRLLAWDCSWNRRAVRTLGYVPSRAQLRRNRHPDTGEASVIRRVSWFCHFHQGPPSPHLRIPNSRSGRSARRKGDSRTVPEYTWAPTATLYTTNSNLFSSSAPSRALGCPFSSRFSRAHERKRRCAPRTQHARS